MRGLILFAHGARDPAWAHPLERLRDRLQVAEPTLLVETAFLEIMAPDLATAAQRLIAAGCTALVVVPIFFGQGGHVRRDLAGLVDALVVAHPTVAIHCATAVGEDDSVLDAVARYCVAALDAARKH